MGMTVSEGGGDFELPEEGLHIARCIRAIDLGKQHNRTWNKTQPKILLVWELPEQREETEDGDRPKLIFASYTATLDQRGNLRKDLESWRGRSFTAEELGGFRLENLLGVPCQLTIVHSEDGKYANIKAITAAPKGAEIRPQEHPSVYFDLDNFDQAVFDSFSEGLQQKINNSTERRKMLLGEDSEPNEQPQSYEDIPF